MAGYGAAGESVVTARATLTGRRVPDRERDRLVALHRLSTLVAQQRRAEDVLREALQSAVALIGGDAGAIHRWSPEAGLLRCVVADGRHEPIIRSELRPGEGLTGRVFLEQTSIIENAYATSTVGTSHSREAGLRAAVAVPISHGGHCLGILSVGSYDEHRAFVDEDAQLLEMFAAMVAVALENAELNAELENQLEQIRTLREQLQQIVDHSPAAISLKDRDGRYALTNRQWLEIFAFGANLGEDGAIGKTDAELYPPNRAQNIQRRDRTVVTTGQTLEYEVTVTDGTSHRTYCTIKFPVVDRAGQPYAVCSISTDVTERRRWEAEIETALHTQRAANEQLEQLNRAKSDFVSILSHEFRSPLTGIQGFSELMRDESMGIEEMKEYSADINREAERLNRMINELLDLDRMESGRMTLHVEIVDLGDIMTRAVASARPRAPGHRLSARIDPLLPALTADRDKLMQVTVNLLDNAIKYSPDGGEVVVGARGEGQIVHLWVSDQGLGIPAEALETVFERYSRVESDLHRSIHGTGLGLPIVRQIVELHGGRAWVESTAGAGSTFHVTLPLTGPPNGRLDGPPGA